MRLCAALVARSYDEFIIEGNAYDYYIKNTDNHKYIAILKDMYKTIIFILKPNSLEDNIKTD